VWGVRVGFRVLRVFRPTRDRAGVNTVNTSSVVVTASSETKNAQRLALVRGVHTFIYIVMATSTFVLVYAGLTGAHGWWLWVALTLLAVETLVFAGNGMKCPLTALAVSYGAEKGYAFDTFLPERATRHTFRFFGSLMSVGLVLLALRWLGVIGP
jgi:hypothetical protein